MGGIKFIGMSEEDFLNGNDLHKYLPLEYAIKDLLEHQLYASTPEKWADPYERRYLNAKYPGDKIFPWKNRVFCLCFTGTYSSEPAWKMYSNNCSTIRLTINKHQLLLILKNFVDKNRDISIYIGNVQYYSTNEIRKKELPTECFKLNNTGDDILNDDENLAKLMLTKRVAFKYEDEIRIIFVSEAASFKKGIEIPLYKELSQGLISQITINPEAEKYTTELLKDYFTKNQNIKKWYGPQKVYHSDLLKGLTNPEITKY